MHKQMVRACWLIRARAFAQLCFNLEHSNTKELRHKVLVVCEQPSTCAAT